MRPPVAKSLTTVAESVNLRRHKGDLMLRINPGTEPVEGATYESARYNLNVLLRDVLGADAQSARVKHTGDKEGRYSFTVEYKGQAVCIDMPGIELSRVRYLGTAEQMRNIYSFPRLYVDGASWLWLYAERRLRERLLDPFVEEPHDA